MKVTLVQATPNPIDTIAQIASICYDSDPKNAVGLVKHYEMADAGAYIARKEMNEIGCNIEEWNKERSE